MNATCRFSTADALLRGLVGVRFTAALLRVERRGVLAFERAYGTVDDAPSSIPIDGGTPFDLASLTKIFVATAALRAVDAGAVSLDAPLSGIVPEWKDMPHEAITLRSLLAHTSGMQSGADYRALLGWSVERYALLQPLCAPVFERVIYSDLGFIALGCVLERLHGASLASVVGATVSAVGGQDTGYRPRAPRRAHIPATEDDGWRGRLRGVVHDEKAYLMGGVAGHAGLFGSAYDVARIAESFLGWLCGRTNPALSERLAREACSESAPDAILRRGLGWALKTRDENSCGRLMGPRTFGHTGFTGTCMWCDPDRDLSIVLLTNAVYYGRNDLRDVRAAVCDAVVEAVAGC